MKKLMLCLLLSVSSSYCMDKRLNPPRQVVPRQIFAQRRQVSATFQNCFVPVTVFQMKRCFQNISALVSDYSDSEDVIMVHNVRKHSISSAYSLPDMNIYIRNWPKLHEASIKVIYNKNIPGLEVLALLMDLFVPETFTNVEMR